jgi:hypothetical protein
VARSAGPPERLIVAGPAITQCRLRLNRIVVARFRATIDVVSSLGGRSIRSGSEPVCTENLDPGVVMMKSAEYRVRTDDSSALNRARDRCIFIQ